ncbi:MAG: cytochrome c [Gammaproteobacteria bacterium]|nr:cytochrome c [Gammaproteobacteria bacterium]
MSMIKNRNALLFIALFFSTAPSGVTADDAEIPDAQSLFKQKCSLCHAIDKKKLGPAVNTMSNGEETLRQAIIKGKNSMPGYEGKLTRAEIDALVDYLLANQ